MRNLDTADANQPLREDKQQQDQPRVVIVGAGFGRLEAAKALRHVPVQVTIIDRWNHRLFQPMLYQVTTAGLSIEALPFSGMSGLQPLVPGIHG